MTECAECGVTSQGAFLVDVDGELLCEDCRGPGSCERCGRETSETTLSGSFRCPDCQEVRRSEETSRPEMQKGLGEWSG